MRQYRPIDSFKLWAGTVIEKNNKFTNITNFLIMCLLLFLMLVNEYCRLLLVAVVLTDLSAPTGEFLLHILIIHFGDGVEEQGYNTDTEENSRDNGGYQADTVCGCLALCRDIA